MFCVDPRTSEYPWQTTYAYHRNSPITIIDYFGGGDNDDEFDKDGNKISDLGGNKVNFYHQEDGSTIVECQETCATNTIKGGEALIRGYAQRDKSTSWSTLYWEWEHGNGPAKSLLSDFDNTTEGFFGSMDNAFSTYASKGRSRVLSDGKPKAKVPFDYSEVNPLTAGSDGWEQFLGRSNLSYYKLGDDKVLFMLNDSKSMNSFFYRMWPFGNHERGDLFWGSRNGNTYQTYIWIETMTEVEIKNKTKQDYIDKMQKASIDLPSHVPPSICFRANSLVAMKLGDWKEIQNIKIGDTIISYSSTTKVYHEAAVIKVESSLHSNIVEIKYSDETKLICTTDHPILGNDNNWYSYDPELTKNNYSIHARKLKPGVSCRGLIEDKKISEVKLLNSSEMMYNISYFTIGDSYVVNGIIVNKEK